ncbi:MAG: prepilin-type N-terminal cleavage/methylation domain-containing protein [Phycisphaera sp.]|nr:prepilin-type N-terminal cleavage/methylation domain-containing protein [Phycisphaera sp.]
MPMSQNNTNHGSRIMRRRGFTLVEMMVVVVIIIGLLSILVPAITAVTGTAGQVAEKQFLAAIQVGLQAYKLDFSDYPPSWQGSTSYIAGVKVTGWDGGEIMTQAMVGPLGDGGADNSSDQDGTTGKSVDDGHVGYGFTVGGRQYGPYITIKHDNSLAQSANSRWILTMVSSQSKRPFLYYRAVATDMTKSVGDQGVTGKINDSTETNRIWGTNGRFDKEHNGTLDGSDDPVEYWWNSASDKDADAFTFSLRTAEYLLVSPGPDEQFGDKTSDDNVSVPATIRNNLTYDDQVVAGR